MPFLNHVRPLLLVWCRGALCFSCPQKTNVKCGACSVWHVRARGVGLSARLTHATRCDAARGVPAPRSGPGTWAEKILNAHRASDLAVRS